MTKQTVKDLIDETLRDRCDIAVQQAEDMINPLLEMIEEKDNFMLEAYFNITRYIDCEESENTRLKRVEKNLDKALAITIENKEVG